MSEYPVHDLDHIDVSDPERAHAEADAILLASVHPAIRRAYERVVERSAWWAGA